MVSDNPFGGTDQKRPIRLVALLAADAPPAKVFPKMGRGRRFTACSTVVTASFCSSSSASVIKTPDLMVRLSGPREAAHHPQLEHDGKGRGRAPP